MAPNRTRINVLSTVSVHMILASVSRRIDCTRNGRVDGPGPRTVRLSSTRDPGLTGGVSNGVDSPAGRHEAVGSMSGNLELKYSPKSWDAVGDAESGPSPGSPITASTEESLPCSDVNVSSPATFGPGQYLPAARATMYGRCLRSAAVSARAVRGMGRRRVGRSTAETHTGCRSPNSREGWQTRIENSN